MNTELKRNKEGQAILFNQRIGLANLSDGQKILLQFCLALFAQEASLDSLIILMDEPENHLHPAALIEVLDKIIPHVSNGQIWIATHSINVLAHFDPMSIWYMEKGTISYAGNVPHKVLESLLGDEEEISRLSNFLLLPSQMASNKFAFESLFYPEVLLTGSEDHQIKQISSILEQRIKQGETLRILDFGMGKGRLLSTIIETADDIATIPSWIDYFGYDKFDTYKQQCESLLHNVYGDTAHRYFNTIQDILKICGEHSFDIIIMCNVFHEIDPHEWLNLFVSEFSISNLLKPSGDLIIVEDQLLAVGERAHLKGFLVFDELEFKKLFKITSE
ncbi:MAG: hypothetical protein EOO43_19465, partial [Flavobacterium sp.]